jgi:predicted flavoprotein YhiN
MEFKIGDYVSRNSYGNDIVFVIVDIKEEVILKGVNMRLVANSPIEDLVKVIKNMTFNVVGCFDNNQVFSGGVDLNDLDDNLMSKKVPNLYFCGEVCDVDGVCGGYNLQWAWTSGKIVGDSL